MRKTTLKTMTIIIASTLILSLLGVLLWSELSFLHFMNAWFLLSLILFLLGAALYIIERGFFQGITYSFKRFFSKMSRQGRYAEELFGESEHLSEVTTFTYTKAILYASVVQLIMTFFLSYFFI